VSKRLLPLAFVLAWSALALVACGGSSDASQIEDVIETSASGTDPADCTTLLTRKFVEQTTQESGRAAIGHCEVEAERGEGSKSARVARVEVDGSTATAEVTLSGGVFDGQSLEVELVKDGDQWKLDEVVKFTKLRKGKLVETFEREFSKPSSELSSTIYSCFVEVFKKAGQAEIEELLLSGSPKAFEELAESCS